MIVQNLLYFLQSLLQQPVWRFARGAKNSEIAPRTGVDIFPKQFILVPVDG
jgi:hypothetical protein